jgi:hypothetical protein
MDWTIRRLLAADGFLHVRLLPHAFMTQLLDAGRHRVAPRFGIQVPSGRWVRPAG